MNEPWQIRVTDTRDGSCLCTSEMPRALLPWLGYSYESCMFYANGDSDVVARYQTQNEAEAGHAALFELLMYAAALP